MKILVPSFLVFFSFSIFADSKEIPFTLEDRDRLIRLETRIDEGFKSINERFESLDKRFESQNEKFESRFDAIQKQIDFTNSLIIALLAGILGSVFYMWWDRRSANAPLKDDIEALQKKEKNLLKVLKEYADTNPNFKSIFDRAAIL